MSTLTVRTPGGQNLNICDSEWYLRNEENTGWIRIDPQNDLRVRHGSNEYWLPITCDGDNELCPPESIVNCWPGYSGIFDSAEFKSGGATGYLVCDCNGQNCKTYTGHTPSFDVVGGRFFSTAPVIEGAVAPALPTTLFGSQAEITEMLVKAGNRSGAIDVSVLALDPGVRVRIYHDCDLLGDSSVSGNYFNVFFSAEPPETVEDNCGVVAEVNNFITVRVDAPAGARWRIRLGAVNTVVTSSYQRPAPCFGTFSPHLPCFVDDEDYIIPGVASYEQIHEMPSNGTVRIDTTIQGDDPVTLSVFYNGGLLATTTTANSPALLNTTATLAFEFAATGGDNFIVIRYEAPRQYNDWSYSIYCPGVRGSRNFMMPSMPVANDVMCSPLSESLAPEYTVAGRGAPYNDVYFDYQGKAAGVVVVEYFASSAVQIFLYQGTYPSETLVGATPDFIAGHNRFFFDFDPAKGTVVHARVVGPCCPDWAFVLSNPVPKPVINIYDAEIVRGGAGQVSYLCFNIELGNKMPKPVTFDWVATPLTALESPDGTCTITEEVPPSPYCNIVPTGTGRGGPYDNNVNIGYTQALQVSSSLHDPNCAPGGQYFVLETDINIPADGVYTVVGTADDNLDIYLDCELIFKGPVYGDAWRDTHRGSFNAKAGWQAISAVYQNVPNCTVGWVKFVILDAAGTVIFASTPELNWRSKAGTISVEPAPVAQVFAADYNKSSGSGAVPACTLNTQVCVPVCGTDLMGPDVTLQLTLSNVQYAALGDLTALGTIKNANYFECDQQTNIAVLDGGDDPFVNRGARRMYINKLAGNSSAAYVMDTEIVLAQSGVHTLYFYGLDVAELYVDCRNVLTLNNSLAVGQVRVPMNVGKRKIHINYYTNASNGRRTGYAALAIVDPNNRVVYVSNAADWRGRIIAPGNAPACNQFAESCLISGNTIEQQSHTGDSANFTVGYGAIKVRTSLHSNASQGSGTWTLQYQPMLPAGTYTVIWSIDDSGLLYINCNLIGTKTTNWRDKQTSTFTVTDGSKPTLFTVVYSNGSNVTWANWVILDAAGNPVSVSAPNLPGQASAIGNAVSAVVGEALGETWYSGKWVIHRGRGVNGGGLSYAWWSAELDWEVPEDGYYYAIGVADDAMELYVDCQNRPINGTQFYLDKGATKMHVRCYNQRVSKGNWFSFNLYRADGSIAYTARKDGWKAKPADLDFSGMS